jgi:hypothetical protein
MGFCEPHYQRDRKVRNGQSVRLDPRVRNERGEKKCQGCERWLPEWFYAAHKHRRDGLSRLCIECKAADSRWAHIRRKYGLTRSQFEQLVADQDGKCPICLDQLTDSPCVDHDHTCCGRDKACSRCVRGLLCSMCNSGIGYLRDSAEVVGRAHEYLARAR